MSRMPDRGPLNTYITIVKSKDAEPRFSVFALDEEYQSTLCPIPTLNYTLAHLLHMDGNEYEFQDAYCSVCGSKKARWIDGKFWCDGRCELATSMLEFWSEVG